MSSVSVKWPTYLKLSTSVKLSRTSESLTRQHCSHLTETEPQLVGPGTCCMATEHLCCHGQREQSSMLKLSGELQRWTCSCLSWNLPRWEGTSFPLLSIMKTGLWKQDSGSTAENNRGLIGTQAKLCDIFLLQHSARLSVFFFCFVFFFVFFLKSPYQFWSGLITHDLLISNHTQKCGWFYGYKEEKDSTYKYMIIYSIKAFILMQNKTGKIYIAICNKRSKSLMWY